MRQLDAQIAEARRSLASSPASGPAHRALADLLLERRRANAALVHYGRALRRDPLDAVAHSGQAVALVGLGRQVRGLYHASEALRLEPDDPRALGELLWVLATSSEPTLRAPEDAIRRAEATSVRSPRILDALAAAYAAAGRYDEAAETARRAITAATTAGDHSRAHAIERRLALYQRQESFVGPPVDPG